MMQLRTFHYSVLECHECGLFKPKDQLYNYKLQNPGFFFSGSFANSAIQTIVFYNIDMRYQFAAPEVG